MKIIGIIASRYASTRFPAKALADIYGKPMFWWVYQNSKQSKKLTKLYIATDDIRISSVCEQFNIPYIMTDVKHVTAANRLYEVSCSIGADYYVQINGDEPIIDSKLIDSVIPNDIPQNKEFGTNLVCEMTSPAEVNDPTNIKVIFNNNFDTIYMSRAPIPYPYKTISYKYYKHIGIIGYNKKMLDLYGNSNPGITEAIEGVDTLRFIDYGKEFKSVVVENVNSISIDTPKDLEYALKIIKNKLDNKELEHIKELL
ncbi:TPA: 3-deoxy-manno-octulosonate cytidylyltransferase [Campylobacter coli]|nr:3-deoxy-manno-octulosonate cytidylyltransferase [Campylobacter coli]